MHQLFSRHVIIMKTKGTLLLAGSLAMFSCTDALATPSTQIWSPSTDVQAYKVWHLGIDNYIRTSADGAVTNNVFDTGLTVGVLPSEKVHMEVGIDYMETGTSSPADESPIYFNAKLGIPEDALGKGAPALVQPQPSWLSPAPRVPVPWRKCKRK